MVLSTPLPPSNLGLEQWNPQFLRDGHGCLRGANPSPYALTITVSNANPDHNLYPSPNALTLAHGPARFHGPNWPLLVP